MATEPTPQFITSIAAAVEYWRRRTEELDDDAIARLDEERQNLYRAVEFGLKRPETWEAAAEVALQAFDLVERHGYWREWMPMLEVAVAQCDETQQGLKCRLLNRLGYFYRQDRQLDMAIAMHQEAEARARALDDRQALAEALYYLSGDYLEKRAHGKAEHYGLAALAAFSDLDNFSDLDSAKRWLATTYDLLGKMAGNRGDIAAAEARLAEAIARWRELNRPLPLVRTLINLANALWPAGKVDKAKTYYNEANTLLASTTYELDKIVTQLSLGSLYYHLGQLDQAEAAFRRADSSFLRRSGHIVYQAHVTTNLGSVLLERGRPVEAEYYLRTALELWQQADDDVPRAATLGKLGQALAAKGQKDAALELYNEAIELLHRYPDDDWAGRHLANISARRQTLVKEIREKRLEIS